MFHDIPVKAEEATVTAFMAIGERISPTKSITKFLYTEEAYVRNSDNNPQGLLGTRVALFNRKGGFQDPGIGVLAQLNCQELD